MARLKDLAITVNDILVFDPTKLIVDPDWNARHRTKAYEEGIQELMESILEHGVLEPLTVYVENGQPHITNGHRRQDALMRLWEQGHQDINVRILVEPKGSNEMDRLLSQITRNSGVPFTPVETAEVCKRLIAKGWDVATIAKKISKSDTYVDNLLLLSTAPMEVVAMMDRDEFAASTVIQAIKEHGSQGCVEALKEATALAAMNGKDKATPKHLKEVRENRASEAAALLAPAETEQVPEGSQETLEGATGGEEVPQEPRVTPLIPEAAAEAAKPAKVAQVKKDAAYWMKMGPKLQKIVEDMICAQDLKSSVEKAAAFYRKNIDSQPLKG
jgi:ParB/RepB/Spo0J family partition protein